LKLSCCPRPSKFAIVPPIVAAAVAADVSWTAASPEKPLSLTVGPRSGPRRTRCRRAEAFARYGNRVTEPELKGAFAALFLLMWLGERAHSHAVLPAFLLGLALARTFARRRVEQQRFRVVAFALLTPFFFVRSGMNVSLGAVWASLGLLGLLLLVKVALKFVGVYPLARRWVPEHAAYTTLLMSTGLTFGTISATYGYNAGIIDRTQFSVLVAVVVLSAVVPTAVAQRLFTPQLVPSPGRSTVGGADRPEGTDSRGG